MKPHVPENREKAGEEQTHFDRLVEERGSTWWGRLTPAGRLRDAKKIRLFRELIRPRPGERLLELGCGAGEFTRQLAGYGIRVAAFDLSPSMGVRSTFTG